MANCGEGGLGQPPTSSQLGFEEVSSPSTLKSAPKTHNVKAQDTQAHIFLDMPTSDNPALALQKALYIEQLFTDLDNKVLYNYRVHVDNECMVTASMAEDHNGRAVIVLAPQEVYLRSSKKNDYKQGFQCGRINGKVPRHANLAQLKGYTRVVVVAQPKSNPNCMRQGPTDKCKYFDLYVGVNEYGEARIPHQPLNEKEPLGEFKLRGPKYVVEGGLAEYKLTHTVSDTYCLGDRELLGVDGRLGLFWNPGHSFSAGFMGDDVCDRQSNVYGQADVCLELRGDGMRRLGTQGAPYLSYVQKPFFGYSNGGETGEPSSFDPLAPPLSIAPRNNNSDCGPHSLRAWFHNDESNNAVNDEHKEHFFIGFDPHKSVEDPYKNYDYVRQTFRVRVFDKWNNLFSKTRFRFPSNKKIEKNYEKNKKRAQARGRVSGDTKLQKPLLHDEVLCVTSVNELIRRQMPAALSKTGKAPFWYSVRSNTYYDLAFDPNELKIMGQAASNHVECKSKFNYYAVDAHFSWASLEFSVALMPEGCPSQKELQKLPKCATKL